MLTPANLALLATVAAYCVAAARLFNLAKPLYSWIPSRYQPIAIALGAGLPQLADALLSAQTKQQLVIAVGSTVVAFLVAVKGAPHDPTGSGSAVGPVLPVLVLLLLIGCDPRKPPCDEDKLRAIDERYVARVVAICISYSRKENCPEYPALAADYRLELRQECGQ